MLSLNQLKDSGAYKKVMDCQRVINIAEKYKFYIDAIKAEVKLHLKIYSGEVIYSFNNEIVTNHELWVNDAGFIITKYTKNRAHIAFVFILPEWRRLGIFQDFFEKLKINKTCICFATNNKNMIEFAKKNNFKFVRKTEDKNENYYQWNKKKKNRRKKNNKKKRRKNS